MKNELGILPKYQHHKMRNIIILAGITITTILFFFIPYITEQYTIKNIVDSSKNSVHQIKLTRAYYVDAVVDDIKKFAPNIQFDHDHEGVNGKIPLPTTTIHDLSKIFSEKTGLKYNLYSEYPFKNRQDRHLTQFQKDAIKYTKINKDGLYVKREVMDGEEVLRVAATDYMTDISCVNCHNNHPDATWEKGMWKLNDKRGVLEVVTPIGKQLANNNTMRNYILILLVVTFMAVLFYLSKILMKREKVLLDEKDILEEAVDDKNKELHDLNTLLDEYVISSKTDMEGNLTYVSQAFIDICGYSKEELVGHSYEKIRHPDMSRETLNEIWRVIHKGKVWRGEILNQKKDGTAYWVDAIFSPEYDESGTLVGHNGVILDITSTKETDYLAYHDYLTKLPNRAYFEEVLAHAIKLAKRNNSMLSVIFLDLDNFKNINDTLGHEFGDKVLKVLSTRMGTVLKDVDTIARIGGDEFIILLEDIKNKAVILDFAQEILQL
ncbi:MAG: diguanylate cyclase, partial [Sulfurovum sp.]|nr:diguanylate cyclase [Sulfurovum sp.]NNJ46104.1 diguanylate cyclase [Sulfurovum sp.]